MVTTKNLFHKVKYVEKTRGNDESNVMWRLLTTIIVSSY